MTKREAIDAIAALNPTAQPPFLARFSDEELLEYLDHLKVIGTPRLQGDPHRYDHYFRDLPTVPAATDRAAQPAATAVAEAPEDFRDPMLFADDAPDEEAKDRTAPEPLAAISPRAAAPLATQNAEAKADALSDAQSTAPVTAVAAASTAPDHTRATPTDVESESWLF